MYYQPNTINRVANTLGFSESIEDLYAYEEPHRFYHGSQHILEMLSFVVAYQRELSVDDYNALQAAIIFHDIVYETMYRDESGNLVHANDNEEKSVVAFHDAVAKISLQATRDYWLGLSQKVEELIMETKHHNYSEDKPLANRAIILADLDRFNFLSFEAFWGYTLMLFKEYAAVDFQDFKNGRLKFMEAYANKLKTFMPPIAYENAMKLIPTLQAWRPTIAVYPGSFNPFHIGHLNILEKAEMIFDKVIIAVGNNSEKNYENRAAIPKSIAKLYQVDNYSGYLTDYLKSKPYPLTIIRGLRNSTDLQSEVTQLRWMQDMNKNVKMVSIIPDSDVEHISSSGIRNFEKYGQTSKYRVQE